jgi:uncharacterized protein
MLLSWDEVKRQKILQDRGLDMADAIHVFNSLSATERDNRLDYGEERFVTFGFLNQRLCAVVWTPRENIRHIISMRKTNDREQKKFKARLG